MTAIASSPIAIAFVGSPSSLAQHHSPLSRSPFLLRSPARASSFDLAKAPHLPIALSTAPLPLPVPLSVTQTQVQTVPHPTKATRPTPIVPPAAPPPHAIHSGSISSAFKLALDEINLDECDAHGENALFVCDLAEVYRQALRWQAELGDRVEAFFGQSSCPATVSIKKC